MDLILDIQTMLISKIKNIKRKLWQTKLSKERPCQHFHTLITNLPLFINTQQNNLSIYHNIIINYPTQISIKEWKNKNQQIQTNKKLKIQKKNIKTITTNRRQSTSIKTIIIINHHHIIKKMIINKIGKIYKN